MFTLIAYKDREGRSPLREYTEDLPRNQKAKILAYLAVLEEFGFSLRRPMADSLGSKLGLYELRPGRHRILYFFYDRDTIVLLHAFLKQTDAIPQRELIIALNRKADYLKRKVSHEIDW